MRFEGKDDIRVFRRTRDRGGDVQIINSARQAVAAYTIWIDTNSLGRRGFANPLRVLRTKAGTRRGEGHARADAAAFARSGKPRGHWPSPT